MYSNFSTKVTIFDRFAKLYGTYLARNKNFFLSLQIEQIRRLVTKRCHCSQVLLPATRNADGHLVY